MNTPQYLNSSLEISKEFFKGINENLEKIKKGYEDPLDGVLTYNKNGICTSFFSGEKEISETEILQKEEEIESKIKELTIVYNQVKEYTIGENLKKIYINSIIGIQNKFKMFKNALRLEASKGGYKLNEQKIILKTNEVIKSQEMIYGAKVSETPEERNIIIHKLQQKFTKNKDKLTESERETYQLFLHTVTSKYGTIYDNKNMDDNEESETKIEESEKEKQHKNNKVISKNKLKEYTNKILDVYQKYFIQNNNIPDPKREVKNNTEKKALYVSSKEKLEIPEEYENISKEKLTKVVIGHEIEQHLFGRNNTNRLLGEGFMGNGYDLISEGVAKINEAIAAGEINSISDLIKLKEKPGLGLIGIFICENYNYEQSVEIIRIYHKLGKRKDEGECLKKATDMVKRRKRFFDYNQPGSSIKDSLYNRGKNRVIDYLTEDDNLQNAIQKYKDLNFGKLGKEEMELIPLLKKDLGINDNQAIYTLMISRILNDKLIKGKGSAREYTNPLDMKKIDFSTKRQLIEILKDMNSLESPPQIT